MFVGGYMFWQLIEGVYIFGYELSEIELTIIHYLFDLKSDEISFFWIEQKLQKIIAKKEWKTLSKARGNFKRLSLTICWTLELATVADEFAPKICLELVDFNFVIRPIPTQKSKTFCSFSGTPICINMASMSAANATRYKRNRKSGYTRDPALDWKFSWAKPGRNEKRHHKQDVVSGLFGLFTEWWGRYLCEFSRQFSFLRQLLGQRKLSIHRHELSQRNDDSSLLFSRRLSKDRKSSLAREEMFGIEISVFAHIYLMECPSQVKTLVFPRTFTVPLSLLERGSTSTTEWKDSDSLHLNIFVESFSFSQQNIFSLDAKQIEVSNDLQLFSPPLKKERWSKWSAEGEWLEDVWYSNGQVIE